MRCIGRNSVTRDTHHDEVDVLLVFPTLEQADQPRRAHPAHLCHDLLLAQEVIPRARPLENRSLVHDLGGAQLPLAVCDLRDAGEAAVGNHTLDGVAGTSVWVAEDRGQARIVRVSHIFGGFWFIVIYMRLVIFVVDDVQSRRGGALAVDPLGLLHEL